MNTLYTGETINKKIPKSCKKVLFISGPMEGNITVGREITAKYDYNTDILTVKSPSKLKAGNSMKYLFKDLENLEEVDFSNLITRDVLSYEGLF